MHELGDGFQLKLKSSLTDGVPPVEFFRDALGTLPEDFLWLAFQLTGSGGTSRGTLKVQNPAHPPGYSMLDFKFSISAKSKGLFASGEAVRRALL